MSTTAYSHHDIAELRSLRSRALGVATPTRLVGSSILAGGICGMLASAVALSPEFLRNPVGTLILSFGFGCFVGTVCSPVFASVLRHRQFVPACWLTVSVVAPLVCIIAILSPTLSRLMFLSGLAFCLTTLAARLALPRVWLDEGLCWRCGYDLRGSQAAGRCPECATHIVTLEPAALTDAKQSKRTSVGVYLVGVLIAFGFAATMLVAAWIERRPQPFNDSEWSSVPASSRLPMARDLLAREVLNGLTETDVVRLLGPPTSRYDRDQYSLGGRAALIVTYDASGVVRKAMGSAFPQGVVDEQFDAELWTTGTTPERLRMGRSLFTHRTDTLAGHSREQVHALLGTPDDRHLSLSYTVGPGRGAATSYRERLQHSLMMDKPQTRLVIAFDVGKVAKVYLPVDS